MYDKGVEMPKQRSIYVQQQLSLYSSYSVPCISPFLFQWLKCLGSNALVDTVDQIKVPCLAVASSGLLNALHAGIVVSLGPRAGLDAVLAKLREVINRFFVVRLFMCTNTQVFVDRHSIEVRFKDIMGTHVPTIDSIRYSSAPPQE